MLSEVGFKDSEQSQMLSPAMWIAYIRQDLEAGATKVMLEARESGTSGICRPDGTLRYGLIEEIVESGVDRSGSHLRGAEQDAANELHQAARLRREPCQCAVRRRHRARDAAAGPALRHAAALRLRQRRRRYAHMRDSNNAFHLAIPCADLDAAFDVLRDEAGLQARAALQ